jgi:hypothetical protein
VQSGTGGYGAGACQVWWQLVHSETTEKEKSDGHQTSEWREGDKNKKNDEKTKKIRCKKKNQKKVFFFGAKLASTL